MTPLNKLAWIAGQKLDEAIQVFLEQPDVVWPVCLALAELFSLPEYEVLMLHLEEHLTDSEIAKRLGISAARVDEYRRLAMRRLCVHLMSIHQDEMA